MKKIIPLAFLFLLLSCWKNNEEGEQLQAEDNTPVDSTLIDSVVGQASFLTINSAINQSQKKDSIIPKKDTAKTTAQKKAEAKMKLEKDKKQAEQKLKEAAEKEKQQQEKKVDELIETPQN